MRPGYRATLAGFTTIELLVVTSILTVLSAITLPILGQARDRARVARCLSNARQLGQAAQLYAGDFDERFPSGIGAVGGTRVWAGQGWAGQCIPYARNRAVFACPSDAPTEPGAIGSPVSYGYNINLTASPGDRDQQSSPAPPGAAMSALNAPARTVLLFEVAGVYANISDSREGADAGGTPGRHFSASANGLDHRLYAQRDWSTRVENQYATGYLGGRLPPDPSRTQFRSRDGRHAGGSSYVMSDGHSHWLAGSAVSSGLNALASNCAQDNLPPRVGCGGEFRAAGTDAPAPAVTFSIR